MRSCLSRIVDGLVTQGWMAWQAMVEGSKAAERRQSEAGQVMNRCLNTIINNKVGRGVHQWCAVVKDVLAEERRCGAIMNRTMKHMSHVQHSAVWEKWRDVIAFEEHCCRVMNRCLCGIVNARAGAAWHKWRHVAAYTGSAEQEAEIALLRQQIQLLTQGSAGRMMRSCLNRIVDGLVHKRGSNGSKLLTIARGKRSVLRAC